MIAFFELILFAAVAIGLGAFAKAKGVKRPAQRGRTISCPNCGSPADVRGGHWECPYCGDSGCV